MPHHWMPLVLTAGVSALAAAKLTYAMSRQSTARAHGCGTPQRGGLAWPQALWKREDRASQSQTSDAYPPSTAASGESNRAFDDYRSAAIKSLAEDEREFQTFLERLRHAKDRLEFDQFMTDRKNRPLAQTSDEVPGAG